MRGNSEGESSLGPKGRGNIAEGGKNRRREVYVRKGKLELKNVILCERAPRPLKKRKITDVPTGDDDEGEEKNEKELKSTRGQKTRICATEKRFGSAPHSVIRRMNTGRESRGK